MPGRLRDPGLNARLPALEVRRPDDVVPESSSPPMNATADPGRTWAPGPRAPTGKPDEGWTVAELRDRAAELGISGRWTMRKVELLEALRSR